MPAAEIIVDRNIPDAERAFAPFGTVRLVDGRSLTRDDVASATALIVRSVTRVDEDILRDAPIRFVGTATIGTDHLDIPALERLGVAWTSAPGSNARSVMEYVVAALLELRALGRTSLRGQRLGVIGVGAVGSLVAAAGEAMGMEVARYDPPRERRDLAFRSASLQHVLDTDILTLHVPLTLSGPDATHHLINGEILRHVRAGATVINTSRGGVVESGSLATALASGTLSGAVLDVWEGEPDIPLDLIERTDLATPHIAGYAYDAKLRATWMIADAMSTFFGVPSSSATAIPSAGTLHLRSAPDPLDALTEATRAAYPIHADDLALRSLLHLDPPACRAGFDHLRRNYPVRREFSAWSVEGAEGEAAATLRALGFALE